MPKGVYPRPLPDVLARFWAGVQCGPGCWIWTGAVNNMGYGRFRIPSAFGWQRVLAHRFSWEITHREPIPEGLELDHLCSTPRCVRPDHLEPVTHIENVRRGRAAGRAACPQGHPYGPRDFNRTTGWRKCRICANAASTAAHRRQRERLRAAMRDVQRGQMTYEEYRGVLRGRNPERGIA